MTEILELPIDSITDPVWNSRTNPFDFSKDPADVSFVASVRSAGVQTPIKVRATPTPNKFVLIFGSRRLAASKHAGLKTIPAQVIAAGSGTPASRIDDMVDNVVENIQRRDLTTYEQARAFAELRRADCKLKVISEKTGTSEGHISLLVSMYELLPPEIVTEWQKGNPAATMQRLRDISQIKDKNAQLAAFREKERQLASLESAPTDDDEDETEEEKDSSGTNKGARSVKAGPYKVPQDRYKALVKALRKTKQPAISLAVARYLVGLEDAIKGVIDAPEAQE